MIKLRILPLAFVCGLLSTPSLAQLTTIGPETPGVTESIMTWRQTSVENGIASYSPIFTPIPLGSPTGILGFEGGAEDTPFPFSGGCLSGCSGPPGIQPFEFTELAVKFTKPVSFIDVLQLQPMDNGGGLFAYNAQGQLVATCGGYWDSVSGLDGFELTTAGSHPSKCYSLVSHVTVTTETATTSFVVSALGITTVIAGGYLDQTDGVTAVKFGSAISAPEPGTFSLLALALAGLAVARKRWT